MTIKDAQKQIDLINGLLKKKGREPEIYIITEYPLYDIEKKISP